LVQKLKPRPGLAGILNGVAIFAALAFAIGTYLGFVLRPPAVQDLFHQTEIVGFDLLGVNRSVSAVPYPQTVFCPLYKEGVMGNIACWKSKNGLIDHMNPITAVKLKSQFINENPNNFCWGINVDGQTIGQNQGDWQYSITCNINSTNVNAQNVTWAGRVRVYIDRPGSTDFETCAYCVDGIDGTIAVKDYVTISVWQAHVFQAYFNRTFRELIDYKTESTRLPYAPTLSHNSDMEWTGGYFSPSVWYYDRPDVLDADRFHGEAVAHRAAFVGAIGLVSYFVWSCLSTTTILLFVGAPSATIQ